MSAVDHTLQSGLFTFYQLAGIERKNLLRPALLQQPVLYVEAEGHGGMAAYKRHLEGVALGSDLITTMLRDAFAHELVVHLLHLQVQENSDWYIRYLMLLHAFIAQILASGQEIQQIT